MRRKLPAALAVLTGVAVLLFAPVYPASGFILLGAGMVFMMRQPSRPVNVVTLVIVGVVLVLLAGWAVPAYLGAHRCTASVQTPGTISGPQHPFTAWLCHQ
jgi:hypothetical protein